MTTCLGLSTVLYSQDNPVILYLMYVVCVCVVVVVVQELKLRVLCWASILLMSYIQKPCYSLFSTPPPPPESHITHSHWPQTLYIVSNDLELLILLSAETVSMCLHVQVSIFFSLYSFTE